MAQDGTDGHEVSEDALFGDGGGFVEEKDALAQGEIEDIPDDEAEDLIPKRTSPDPGKPTQAEIDDHQIDHLPFRSWCEECVKGKGTGEQHRSGGHQSAVPVIAFDYLFISERGVHRREELEDGELARVLVKILVVKDLNSKALFAHVVPQKGVDPNGYAVVRLMEDVRWLGYTKVILKADNEHAIVRLLKDALKRVKTEAMDQVSQENPPAYDSRANGSVENAIKQLQGHLRTLKLSLEKRLKKKIPNDHPLTSWLVEYAAWLLTVRTRGSDGRSPYHRIRGRNFGKRLLEFGEQCLYKLPVKGKRHEEDGKLAERWRRGIFLGFARYTSEYVFWDQNKIIKARCHQRMVEEVRWPSEIHEGITVDAHQTYSGLEPEKFDDLEDIPKDPGGGGAQAAAGAADQKGRLGAPWLHSWVREVQLGRRLRLGLCLGASCEALRRALH